MRAPQPRELRIATVLAAVAAILAGIGCGASSHDPAEADPPSAAVRPFRFFSPTSFWNAEPAADTAADPQSAQLVSALLTTVEAEQAEQAGPWINTTSFSIPLYTVPAHQARVRVTLTRHRPETALSRAWSEVPLPSDAKPAAGSDGMLAVWQPSSGRLWEFWRLTHGPDGWQASWGGAMQRTRKQSGVYGPWAWPGAHRWWGASASSLSLLGGLITLEQLRSGEIDHALAMAIPNVRADAYSSPAQRTDGASSEPTSLPEGAHLRLNPSLDLAALHLPRLTMMIARAAQRYGIFVTDRSPIVEFYSQDPIPTGSDPYAGSTGYFEGRDPRQLLASFPWRELQVLPMSLHDRGRTG